MPDVTRILPENARDKQQSGDAFLVCAYDDEAKCRQMHLEGSLTLNELNDKLGSVPEEKEIIFYCA